MTTVKADTWQAHRLDDVDAIRAGLLDIIDPEVPTDPLPTGHPFQGRHGRACTECGRPRSAHERGPAGRRDQDATYRPGDLYTATPRSPGRRHERSDPTGNALLARERAIQGAVTDLSATVSALVTVVEHDPPPDELETRTVPATYTRPARTVVDADPTMCRIHVLEVCDWLEGLVRTVADGWREGWSGDVTQIDRAKRVGTVLGGLRRRVAPDRPAPSVAVCRPCVECGGPVPLVEGRRAHGRCRTAKSRRAS